MAFQSGVMNQDSSASDEANLRPDRPLPKGTLNLSQFKVAVIAANQQFALIRKKYPELKGYLDLSLGGEWAGINESPATMLNKFPAAFIDNEVKTKAQDLLNKLKLVQEKIQESKTATSPGKNKLKEEERQLTSRVDDLVPHFEFNGQSEITIGFHDLNYELIWKLQVDDLVDRNLTPQTRASIRIVLGLISDYVGETVVKCAVLD